MSIRIDFCTTNCTTTKKGINIADRNAFSISHLVYIYLINYNKSIHTHTHLKAHIIIVWYIYIYRNKLSLWC